MSGGGDTEDVYFRLEMSTKMVELKKAYAKRVGVPVSSINFSLDGQDIDDDETPADFHWEEGDVIEAKKVNGISSYANDLNSESSSDDDDGGNGSQHIKFTTLEDMELFHQAAKSGSLRDIQKLCEKDGFLHVNSQIQDDTRKTPLHRAAENGHFNVVKFLVKHNADTNAKDKMGLTPLQYACQFGHIKIIKLLLVPSSIIQTPSQRPQTEDQEWTNNFENTPLALLLQNNRIQVLAEDDEVQITESVEPVPSTSNGPVPSTSKRKNQTSENHPETEMSKAKRRRIADNDASMNQIMLELKRNNEKLTEVISKQNDLAEAKSEIDNLKIQQKNSLVRNMSITTIPSQSRIEYYLLLIIFAHSLVGQKQNS